jgi:hypothetical protein
VTNITLRFADRGDGGAAGPTMSGPAADRENNPERLNVIAPDGYTNNVANFSAAAELHLRHGYQRGPTVIVRRLCRCIEAGNQKALAVFG